MDLKNGWKYVLENYPQVTRIGNAILDLLLTVSTRSTLSAQSLLARATEVTPSSMFHLHLHPQKCVDDQLSPVGFKETLNSASASKPWYAMMV